nr:uncharacterized protein CTRU02_13853 [Colletotrichum truncatum]KAF6782855.1 hypothetical protein CTRU02_13853 [Colletotrichum truncatum]
MSPTRCRQQMTGWSRALAHLSVAPFKVTMTTCQAILRCSKAIYLQSRAHDAHSFRAPPHVPGTMNA